MADTRLRAIIESVYESAGTDAATQAFGAMGTASEQAAPKVSQTGLSLTDLKSGIDLASQAAQTFTGVFKQAFEMGKEGATIIQTADSLTLLATEAGYAGDLIGDLEKAAGGTVDDLDYMGSALKTLAGTSGDLQSELAATLPELLNISRAVVKLNPTVGTTAQVFDAMTRALQTGQTRGLKPFGFQIDASADSIEQMNQIMEQGSAMVEKLGGNVESATDPFDRLANSVDNLKDNLLTGLAPALTAAAEGANALLTLVPTVTDALASHGTEIINTGLSYADYTAEMERSIEAAALVLGVQGMQIEKDKILTEEQYATAQATAHETALMEKMAEATTGVVIPSQIDLADAAEKVAAAHAKAAAQFSQANTESTLLAGAVDKLVKGFDPAAVAAGLLGDAIAGVSENQAEAARLTLLWAVQAKTAEIASKNLTLENENLSFAVREQTEAARDLAVAELELMLNQQSEIENLQTLTDLVETDKVTRLQYIEVMADQKVTTEELNELMGIENETIAATEEALFLAEQAGRKQVDAQQAIVDQVPKTVEGFNLLAIAAEEASGDYPINIHVSVTGDAIPGAGGGKGGGSDDPGNTPFYQTVDFPDPTITGTSGASPLPVNIPTAPRLPGWWEALTDDERAQIGALMGGGYGLDYAYALVMGEALTTGGGTPAPGGSPTPIGGGFPDAPRAPLEVPIGDGLEGRGGGPMGGLQVGTNTTLNGIPVTLIINNYFAPPSVLDDLAMVQQMAQAGA